VILNTAYPSYKDNFMSWAADAYVIKSSDLTELKARIKVSLDKKNC
jgi:DNA-binding response OmpR family regulator